MATSSPRKRVLIIEDDPTQSEALCKLLERRNLDTSCAETLAEGLACVNSEEYDCVVLDLGLPDSESFATACRIPEFAPIPVVAITGSDDRDLIREVTRHHAGYAMKGSSALTLMEKVLLRIERHSPSREIEEQIVDNYHQARTVDPAPDGKPWFLQWVPLFSLTLALAGATATGGMFLYRAISEDATKASRTEHRIERTEAAMTEFRGTMETMARVQADLGIKAQTGIDDRAGIHRELGALAQQQRELKEDVVRRLERIEDGQTNLLKELSKR